MSVRHTTRKLTGRARRYEPEIVLGYRADGSPGVTLSIDWETYGCYNDPEHIERLIEDLKAALTHLKEARLDGPPVS